MLRIDDGFVSRKNLVSFEFYSPDLNDPISLGIQSGCFEVESDNGRHARDYIIEVSQTGIFPDEKQSSPIRITSLN
jgi:hypothetical protein